MGLQAMEHPGEPAVGKPHKGEGSSQSSSSEKQEGIRGIGYVWPACSSKKCTNELWISEVFCFVIPKWISEVLCFVLFLFL